MLTKIHSLICLLYEDMHGGYLIPLIFFFPKSFPNFRPNRGADCDDSNSNIYPGRRDSTNLDPNVDHNCNGIFGVDSVTKKSYEDLYCSGTKQYGTVLLGDSAGGVVSVTEIATIYKIIFF